jgi:hypothetical protein
METELHGAFIFKIYVSKFQNIKYFFGVDMKHKLIIMKLGNKNNASLLLPPLHIYNIPHLGYLPSVIFQLIVN